MEHPRSILIIQTAFIGDVILATALIESLYRALPETKLDFLVRRGNEQLLLDHPHLRNVLVFDKRNKYTNLVRLILKIRKSHYDYVINVQRFATTGLMAVFSGGRVTIGFDKNPLSFLFSKKVAHTLEGLHEIQRNHLLIESIVGKERSRPRLYPSPKQFEKVASFKSQPFITVSPASVWFTKQYPVEKWIELLSVLPHQFKVFLLGASNDRPLCETIVTGTSNKNLVNLAGELSLLESAALMKDADMNYVNDSAPMHLASGMNAPVTAIFCSTVPSFGFGPLSDKSFIIETIEKLDCRPCGLHGYRSCPEGHFNCALTIQKEQLLATIVRVEPLL